VTLVTKKCPKSDLSIYKKVPFFPIEKAAIVSLSKGNRQEYEHLYRYFLYPRLFGSKGGAKRTKMASGASEKYYLRKNNLGRMAN